MSKAENIGLVSVKVVQIQRQCLDMSVIVLTGCHATINRATVFDGSVTCSLDSWHLWNVLGI